MNRIPLELWTGTNSPVRWLPGCIGSHLAYLGGHIGECGALVGKRLVVHNVPVKYIELVVGHGVEVSQYGAFANEMSRGVYHYPAIIVSRFVRYLGHLGNGILKKRR